MTTGIEVGAAFLRDWETRPRPGVDRKDFAVGPGSPVSGELRRADPRWVLALIHTGGAAVLAMWWLNTPRLLTTYDWLVNAGRVAGLMAAYAVIILIALMARIPSVERGVGADRLARWHALGGRYTVMLATSHALLIIWAYAQAAQVTVTEETRQLTAGYPGAVLATAALGLFLVIGAVSARAARKRLRYETWHLVHLCTYIAVALSFSHQLTMGAEFMGRPWAQGLWWALYLGVFAALVWNRWLTPVRMSRRHRLRVASVEYEGPGIVSITMRGRRLDELAAEPGQFFRWRFLAPHHWWAANPFSLSAPPTDTEFRITVKETGDHTRLMHRLRPGTRVVAEGPYGAMSAAASTSNKVLLLAGGIGITPMRTLFETIPARPGDLTLIYRARTPEEIVFREELEEIARERGAVLYYSIGKRGSAGDAFTENRLSELVPGLRRHDVYICASPPMTEVLVTSLLGAGVPKSRIHTEIFEF